MNREKIGKKRRWPWFLLGGLAGLWLVLAVALQVVLNSSVLSRIVGNLALEYVDGTVTFSGIKASMLKSFPNLNVTIDDFSITYPHERYAAYDSLAAPGDSLMNLGRGIPEDTLAHFDNLSLSVNYLDLAFRKKVHVKHALLKRPRIFVHQFDSTVANWNMFRFPASEAEDTGLMKLPPVSVGKVSLEDAPYAVYTSLSDTLEAALAMRHLGIQNRRRHYGVDLDTDVFLAMNSIGRMDIPVKAAARLYVDWKNNSFEVKDLAAKIAMLDVAADGKLVLGKDSTYVKAYAGIDEEPVKEITEYFGANFPLLGKLRTDALLSVDAHCDGYFVHETGEIPRNLKIHLAVPDSKLQWEGLDDEGRFDCEATASVKDGCLTAEVHDLSLHVRGADVRLNGSAFDLLCGDPDFAIDAEIHACLDSLSHYLPDSLDITARGRLDGKVEGKFKVSQLDMYNFADIGLTGDLYSDGIKVDMPKDSLFAYLGRTRFSLEPWSQAESRGSARPGKEHHPAGLTVAVDSLYAEYGTSTFVRGFGISLTAHNAEETIQVASGGHPLHGHLKIASVGMMDVDSCFVGVGGSDNVFELTRIPEGNTAVSYMSLTSSNKTVAVREGVNRFSVSGLDVHVAAHPASPEAMARRRNMLDSLQKAYPGVPRDSLFITAFRRYNGGNIPDYLSEKDFVKNDIKIQLGESMAAFLKHWDISGNLQASSGSIITPYFPLENKVSDVRGRFTNNRLDLANLTLQSGASDVSANGYLSGYRRMLTSGRGRLTLNLNLTSNLIDANEVLIALNAGKEFEVPEQHAALSEMDDRTYLNTVRSKAVVDTTLESPLLVLPSNLNAKVDLQASTVRYSDLETSFVSTSIEMKERCLQVTNTLAMTNMGEVFAEGFYSTRTKKDLKAGFDLMLSNITAEKVIQLFPAIDSIFPMLKAFKGFLDCEMAATSSIDTSMNLVLPSIKGMVKIDGRNLSLAESRDLDKLRRTLMFKDKDSSYIDAMSVRGVIDDDHLEVFPFILKVDRYTVALSGIQQFDQRFKYHVSAIKSPIPFKFGVNLRGKLDDWRWKLGRPKFRSTSIPLFDEQVDGIRLNLVNSIHNIFERGVEHAIRQNEQAQQAVVQKKAEEEYSTDQTADLSTEEDKQLNELPPVVPLGVPAKVLSGVPAGVSSGALL